MFNSGQVASFISLFDDEHCRGTNIETAAQLTNTSPELRIIVRMKTKEAAEEQALAVPCPTCGARKNKPCELASGKRRTDPHRERLWAASDKRILGRVSGT